jgi:hypothetical protein
VAAWKSVQEFVKVLKLIPPGVVPTDHIGLERPSKETDLPAVVAWVSQLKEANVGVGGLPSSRKVDADHWEDVRVSRATGALAVEIWAATSGKVIEIADALFQRLETSAVDLRDKGFIRFDHREVNPIEETKLGVDETKKALRMSLAFSIVFEDVRTETIGPDGIIRKVHVEINNQFQEKLDIQ